VVLAVLLGVLAVAGAEVVARNTRYDPVKAAAAKRKLFLAQWKPPYWYGTEAPRFELPNSQGAHIDLSKFRGKPTVLALYSDDARSRTFAREFQKIWEHIGRSELNSVAVVDFPPERAAGFIRETGDRSHYLFDSPEKRTIHQLYRTAPGPNIWLIGARGKVVYATPPIDTDGVPEPELEALYHALRGEISAHHASADGNR